MPQQRDQRHRRGAFGPGFGQQQQQASGCCLRQWSPGAVIGGDVPALQVRDHAFGQSAIGGNHGHAPFGQFQCPAHQHGNGQRLFARMRRFHQPHAGQTPIVGGQRRPHRACDRRQEQAGNRPAARRWRGGDPRAVPRPDFAARDSHAIKQQFQMILRMADDIASAKHRTVVGGRASLPQRSPHRIVERQIKIGQDHRPARQFRHHAQQPCHRRRRRRHPGRHHRMRWRRSAPAVGQSAQQPVAAFRRIARTACDQFRLPADHHPCKQPRAGNPVLRQIADQSDHRRIEQRIDADILDQQPVDGFAHATREPQQRRLSRYGGACIQCQLFAQQPRQDQQPHRGFDRRRNLCRQRIEHQPQRFVEIEIAHHRHARQHQRATAGAHKRLGHGAHGAAAGQQQRQPRQTKAILAIAWDQSSDERIGKPPVRRDRIQLRAPVCHRVRRRAARLRSAQSSADCRLRTTARYATGHRAALRQSRGPTAPRSKRRHRARRATAVATRSGCRCR